MAANKSDQLQAQAEEIERLRTELETIKTAGGRVYPLPHTLRKGVGDLWNGYVEGRERPDNVPGTAAAPAAPGPSNEDVRDFMAAQGIAEAQAEARGE